MYLTKGSGFTSKSKKVSKPKSEAKSNSQSKKSSKSHSKVNPKPESSPAAEKATSAKSANAVSNQEALKVQLLQLQIDKAKCDLEKAQSDRDKAKIEYEKARDAKANSEKATKAATEAELKLAQLTAQVENEQLRLAKAKRDEEIALSQASEAMCYTFYDSVTPDKIRECLGVLEPWARRFPGRPLAITLCSPGGSVIDGLVLYDFLGGLRSKGHYVTVTVLGMAASMGGILLQAGDKRVVGENADVMIHEVSYGAQGTLSNMKDRGKRSEGLWKRLLKILKKRSTLSIAEIESYCDRKDWWLTAKEAVEFGFADEVMAEPRVQNRTKKSKDDRKSTKVGSVQSREKTKKASAKKGS
jgi:ATP-dependent Clp endopeptidase proteolytic subunit ClpP